MTNDIPDRIDEYWPDHDFSIDNLKLKNDHLENLRKLHRTPKIAKWIGKRLEYELRGAYRAGYEYVYIGEPRKPLEWEADNDAFTVAYKAIPSYLPYSETDMELPGGTDWVWREYDLTELTPEQYQNLTATGTIDK